MTNKKIALAYSIENIATAETLAQVFERANYAVQHIYGKKDENAPSVSKQLRSQNAPILLLLSDNFLKSPKCMEEGLKLLHEKKDFILPVVVDGQTVGATDGKNSKIPTKFERVSDIIQYINYWQDQYLDLRRQKREIKDIDEEKFSQHLKTMRAISSEVGEFLRSLRTMDYLYFEDFKANHFEAFFEFLNDPQGWEMYKSSKPIELKNTTPEQSSDEAPPEPEVDLSSIPGYDLIQPESIEDEAESPEKQVEVNNQEDPQTVDLEQEKQEENPVSDISEYEPVDLPVEVKESNLETESGQESDELKEEVSAEVESTMEEEVSVEYEAGKEEVEEAEKTMGGYDLNAAILSAYELMEAGNNAAALSFIQNEVEEHPEYAELRYHLALMLVQQEKDITGAQKQLLKAIDIAPDHTDALFLQADLAILQENYSAAYKYYKKVSEIDPEYSDIYYRMGSLLSKHFEGKEEKAAKYFKNAIRQNPTNIDAVYQYGVLLNESLNRPKKAEKFLRKTIELDAKHPFAYYDLALLFHQAGDEIMAKQYYLQSIEVNPELHTEENDIAFGITKVEEKAVEERENQGVKENTSNGSVIQNKYETVEVLEPPVQKSDLIEEATATPEDSETIEEEKVKALIEEEKPEKDFLKTILITGATSGIGRATAEIFAKNGYKVIITGRREERLTEVKAQLEDQYDAKVHALSFDVCDTNAVQTAVDNLEDEWKNIDILINNAGKAKGYSPIHEGELRHWEEMIDTNLKGLLYLTRAVTPQMVRRKSGHIINIGSSAGKEVYPNGNVYCATKHAVDALTQAMRMDLHTYNIRVGQVSPGHVEETEFAEVRFDGDKEKAKIYEDFQPLTARDVAATIYFMASCPPHVNIQDIFMMGTQQASNLLIDRSGRGA